MMPPRETHRPVDTTAQPISAQSGQPQSVQAGFPPQAQVGPLELPGPDDDDGVVAELLVVPVEDDDGSALLDGAGDDEDSPEVAEDGGGSRLDPEADDDDNPPRLEESAAEEGGEECDEDDKGTAWLEEPSAEEGGKDNDDDTSWLEGPSVELGGKEVEAEGPEVSAALVPPDPVEPVEDDPGCAPEVESPVEAPEEAGRESEPPPWLVELRCVPEVAPWLVARELEPSVVLVVSEDDDTPTARTHWPPTHARPAPHGSDVVHGSAHARSWHTCPAAQSRSSAQVKENGGSPHPDPSTAAPRSDTHRFTLTSRGSVVPHARWAREVTGDRPQAPRYRRVRGTTLVRPVRA